MTSPASTSYDVSTCPGCGAQTVGGGHYVAWCRGCSWNLTSGYAPVPSSGRLAKRRRAEVLRSAESLYRSLEGRDVTRPGWTCRRVASYAIATLVHATSLALVVGGIALIVTGWPHVFLLFVGAVLVTIGVSFRPRLPRLPKDATTLDRAAAPATWRLLDAVSSAVDMPPPDLLVLDPDINAFTGRFGLRRRRAIGIGLGLYALLTPQELVAVLAHEVAHGRNGDLRRGGFVGTAIQTLEEWCGGLESTGGYQDSPGMVSAETTNAAEQLAAVMLTFFRVVPLGLLHLLERLELRAGQRAEYLADQVAAEVAGTDAAAEGMQSMLLAEGAFNALHRAALRNDQDLRSVVRTYRADLPATELERRSTAGRVREHVTDETHPPTMLRVDLIRSRSPKVAAVLLDDEWAGRIDAELATVSGALADQMRADLLDT